MTTEIPFDPFASSAPLIVYIDYKSPYAYLAKDPTYALGDELEIEIDWRPFTLDIPSYLGSARLDKEGRLAESHRTPEQWKGVKYAYHDVRRYASMRGLVARGTTKIWDSSLAGIGMLWAKDRGKAVLRAYSGIVYERFWKRELDIEDGAVIEAVLGEAGASTAGFRDYAAGEGRALHDEIQRAAFDAGIFGVPTYVVGGEKETFFGREHLPRIRWMLTGGRGAPPDIAYEIAPTANPTRSDRAAFAVAIDFTSAHAYLAIAPTRAMANELGVEIDWQPFPAPGLKKYPPPSPTDDRGTRHRRFRAEYFAREVTRYAADRGLTVRGLDRQTDSTLARIGLLWAKRTSAALADEYMRRTFERYWREELNLEDENAIHALLAEIGAPRDGLREYVRSEGRAELERVHAELQNAGVFDAPTYLVNNDVFLGRQHLPLIRQMLSKGA